MSRWCGLARYPERLKQFLQVLASDRSRAEALRRKVADALRYPAFLLFAATCVLVFFLMFVLPQFGAVLRDFGAKIDPVAGAFLRLSEFMNAHEDVIGVAALIVLAGGLLLARQAKFRAAIIFRLVRLPWRPHNIGAASDCHCSAAISGFCSQPALPSQRRCGLSPI